MLYTALVERLINSLRCLPGVGPRSAQRMAFYLLEQGRESGIVLSKTLADALSNINHCKHCRTFTENELCHICSNPKRNNSLLCVVESPADIVAIEQTNSYNGLYFVLMGHLSPIDGIGPNEIGINELSHLITSNEANNAENQNATGITEVIIATNPTVEGEATAHYIANLVHQQNIKCSRIAYGIPMGGELEYIDSNTLARALNGRLEIK